MDIPPALRVSSRRCAHEWERTRQQRRQLAWAVARQAAALLKTHYAAIRVVAFGSLPDRERFHPWSDVDLAAWGLAPERYFEAVAQLLDLGGDIRVDLVMAERSKPSLRSAIEDGVEL
jgi:predicted nucleotidyltransferase